MGTGYTVEEVFRLDAFTRYRNVMVTGPPQDTIGPVPHRLLSALVGDGALSCLSMETSGTLARRTVTADTPFSEDQAGGVSENRSTGLDDAPTGWLPLARDPDAVESR